MEWIEAISNVGFPIALSFLLLWYINKKDEQYVSKLTEIESEIDETRTQTTEALTKVNDALVNNTAVISQNTELLKTLMGKIGDGK